MTDWSDILPSNLWSLPLLSNGISGMVRVVDDNMVIKHPLGGEDNIRDHFIERRIYERLGCHPRVVRLVSFHREGIILERLNKHPLRRHLLDLHQNNELPSTEQMLKWSKQAAEGLQYMHERRIFQVDIGAHNLLLTTENNLKFCDFAGSSIDDEKAWVCPSSHAEYPIPGQMTYQPTIKSELFSLGSVLYEISTTRRPYDDKLDVEIEHLYAIGEFPDTDYLLLGTVIRKCWTSRYCSAGEVVSEIEQLVIENAQAMSRNPSFSSALFFLTTIMLLASRFTRHSTVAE